MANTEHGRFSVAGGKAVEAEPISVGHNDLDEVDNYSDVEKKSSEKWLYWSMQMRAAQSNERRFRDEGIAAEKSYFGDEEKAFNDKEYLKDENKTNIIHANIEVLKPLLFSDVPDPIIRRRFGGDGGNREAEDRIAAIVCQRLAEYLIETSGFETAMELSRDDWLIPGRGTARAIYKAEYEQKPVIDPMTGQAALDPETDMPVMQEVKIKETVKCRHWPWQRTFYGAANTWDDIPYIMFETPMTKDKVKKRFDKEDQEGAQQISELMNYPIKGLKNGTNVDGSTDMKGYESDTDKETSGSSSVSPNDQCMVYEIWDRESKSVIWWSPHYREDVLDESDDPLGLEDFFDTPKPLLAVTKGGSLTPRPEIAFYRARAEEIDIATKKLHSLLEIISVSGFYPGNAVAEVEEILKGENKLVAIANWAAFMEKGGSGGMIQWLDISAIVNAAQALIQMSERSKQSLYEISGISDIVRGQSDPNETLGAQQLKGNYANIRLRDKQRKMHLFAREMIKLMVEISLEHFDIKTIKDITNLQLVETDAELEQINQAIFGIKR